MGYDLLSRNVYCLKEGAVEFFNSTAAVRSGIQWCGKPL